MFQSRRVIDSESIDSENDRNIAKSKQRKILKNSECKERSRFKVELEEHIQDWLKTEVQSTD